MKKVLLIYYHLRECVLDQCMFHVFDNIICDYDTNISRINEIDLMSYDIIVWDIEHFPISELPKTSAFLISKHSCSNDDIIKDIMQLGFDMFIECPFDYDSVKNAMSIYYFIQKCKNND